jgi:hypothetical protein
MFRRLMAIYMLAICWTATAQAAQVCAWMKESIAADEEYKFELWLQADTDMDFLYMVGGKGVVTAAMSGNTPAKATYSLHAGKAETVWSTGLTLDAPGTIDFVVELHQMPADIFSDAPTPTLAKFVFDRNVPRPEKQAPATLARKQCAVLKSPK